LEESFRKKEKEFERHASSLENDMVQKTEFVKAQLSRSLSKRSNQLSTESLKLEQATERLANDMEIATERDKINEETQNILSEQSELNVQLRGKLAKEEREALEQRQTVLSELEEELREQESQLKTKEEANVAPLSPRKSSRGEGPSDTPRFQNPFGPATQTIEEDNNDVMMNAFTNARAPQGDQSLPVENEEMDMMEMLHRTSGGGDQSLPSMADPNLSIAVSKMGSLRARRQRGPTNQMQPVPAMQHADERLQYQAAAPRMGSLRKRQGTNHMDAMQPMQHADERLQ
jgi:hypothetical protein